jgi:hypothetical protein
MKKIADMLFYGILGKNWELRIKNWELRIKN